MFLGRGVACDVEEPVPPDTGSGTAGGWLWRTGPGLARSCGGPRGRLVGGGMAEGVASATAIMQLELQQSFLFMILEVPQIQFNPECRTFQMHAERAGYGVRRSCEPQRQVSAVHFRRGCTVPKTVEFSKVQFGSPLPAQCWFDSGCMICDVPGFF